MGQDEPVKPAGLVATVIEYACGHLAVTNIWPDPAKRAAQLKRLEALPCRDCLAAGWRPAARGPERR